MVMRITTALMRSIYPAAIIVAVSVAMPGPTGASAASLGQDDNEQAYSMKQTESGLEYRDVKKGTGDALKPGQTCVVHYTGWLWQDNAKGKEFDSSVKRGTPFSFRVGAGRVIQGWDEGVSTMKVGGKRELLIPPELAYSARGAGGVIPPNATLFFEVALIEKFEKTDSGLEYIDDKEGDGVLPKSGQTCHVHYTGWLWTNGAKGRKFDSSVDTGQPIPFRLGKGEVIEGWDEGIATMKVGGKRRLLIPAKLGYGRNGNPPEIPGNADLLFEVELVKVK
jgi:FKBP-type peptidyl-prolyl cis-trans isomerase